MKRILVLALLMVVALGALGIGYAAWTDTITVSGNVTTGSLDINLTGEYSGTYVYKDLSTDNTVVLRKYEGGYYFLPSGSPAPDPVTMPNWWGPIGWAQASPGVGEDAVKIEFHNIYPCHDFVADFKVKVDGTVPVKIVMLPLAGEDGFYTPVSGSEDLDDYTIDGKPCIQLVYWDESCSSWVPIDNNEGIQFEPCQSFIAGVIIHLPQDNDLMNQSGIFAARVIGVQWDKFDEGPDGWDTIVYP